MYEDYMQNWFNTYDHFSRNNEYYNQMNNCDMCYDYENIMPYNFMPTMERNNITQNLEDLYPEIYKVLYPMVKKVCNHISRPIDENLIEEMTEDIYSHLEAGNIINVNINVDNDNTVNKVDTTRENRPLSRTTSSNKILE